MNVVLYLYIFILSYEKIFCLNQILYCNKSDVVLKSLNKIIIECNHESDLRFYAKFPLRFDQTLDLSKINMQQYFDFTFYLINGIDINVKMLDNFNNKYINYFGFDFSKTDFFIDKSLVNRHCDNIEKYLNSTFLSFDIKVWLLFKDYVQYDVEYCPFIFLNANLY